MLQITSATKELIGSRNWVAEEQLNSGIKQHP